MRIVHEVIRAATTFDIEANERPTCVDDKVLGETKDSTNRAKIVTRAENERVESV